MKKIVILLCAIIQASYTYGSLHHTVDAKPTFVLEEFSEQKIPAKKASEVLAAFASFARTCVLASKKAVSIDVRTLEDAENVGCYALVAKKYCLAIQVMAQHINSERTLRLAKKIAEKVDAALCAEEKAYNIIRQSIDKIMHGI